MKKLIFFASLKSLNILVRIRIRTTMSWIRNTGSRVANMQQQ
jgi:hypothetical protein